MNKAVFFDLDGTLIRTKSGETFSTDINDWQFIMETKREIKMYVQAGYIPIILSNQGGIEAGYVLPSEFETKFDTIRDLLSEYLGTPVHGLYCPFIDNNHYYRKPNVGMPYKAALELELNLYASVMIGDMSSDKKMAERCNMRYIDVKDLLNKRTLFDDNR
jgi:HAD superfamily hydrolase (TIGR01662 family)